MKRKAALIALAALVSSAAYLKTPLYPVYAQVSSDPVNLSPIVPPQLQRFPTQPLIATDVAQLKIVQTRERNASFSAQLKLKLRGFKDQQKAVVVEKINNMLGLINQNRTDQMMKRLDYMTNILNMVQERYDTATASGKINTSYQASLDQVRTSITQSQALVTTQAEKNYTIKIASESAVRLDVQTTKNQLQNDLQNTEGTVMATKNLLMQTIHTISQAFGGPDAN
jgi:hypothetical protein